MFTRYTDDARQAILLARYEASRRGSAELTTAHVWLGLLRTNKKLLRRITARITLAAVEAMLLTQPAGERISMAADLPLAPDLAAALADAAAEADSTQQMYITSERLALALLRHPQAP